MKLLSCWETILSQRSFVLLRNFSLAEKLSCHWAAFPPQRNYSTTEKRLFLLETFSLRETFLHLRNFSPTEELFSQWETILPQKKFSPTEKISCNEKISLNWENFLAENDFLLRNFPSTETLFSCGKKLSHWEDTVLLLRIFFAAEKPFHVFSMVGLRRFLFKIIF